MDSIDDSKKRIAELERQLEAVKRTALALADSERLYRALFEGTATAVTIRSLEDQTFLDCNAAALRLYRAETAAQLRGSKVTDLSAENQSDGTPTVVALRRHVALSMQNGKQRSEWLARRLDGSPFIADIHTTVLELEGGRRVMQTMIDDITARKAAEVALRRRAEHDELVGRISRRFLDGDVDGATQFAIDSLSVFLGMSQDVVAQWIAKAPTIGGQSSNDDAALFRLVGEMIEMARARARAEQALRSGEERYRTLIERSRDAIFILDLDGKITFASPAATDIIGYSPTECVGIFVGDVIVPEQRGAIPDLIAVARAGVPGAPKEWSVVHKDGSVVRIESIRTPVHDKEGRVVGAQLIVRDIAERHRAEQMRQAAQAELARAKEDAVAASRAKSAFLANMSHELRTPLNGVIGMVELLGRTALDGQQARYVEVARASASLLLSVINDILDFSKIEAGKLEMERIEFSFGEVVEEVATMMELGAEEKGVELTCQTESTLATPLVGDPARVRQVLVNLISNAVKFTARGEVAVRATLDGETQRGLRVRVEVRDTGVGISQEAQKILFQPFSQVDPSTTRHHGGTGLGLAICRELVRRMDGEIGVKSTLGEGSTFWFTVGLERALAGAAAIVDVDRRLSGMRVLAVDDNATNREILRAQLAAASMRCDVAASGEEAIDKLIVAAGAHDPYAIAILDQHMPSMDGVQLARRIRSDARIAGTRLVMLGSIGRPLDGRELLALGVVAWATKPVWRTHLLRALASALDDDLSTRPRLSLQRREPPLLLRKQRILVVEDTPISAEVVAEILRTSGYELDIVVDGLQAVEQARRGAYALVLMDCQLPGIDGYEATRRIRAHELSEVPEGRRRRLPIVALTASATVEDLERARLAGMDGHIAKPVDARRLLSAVAEHAYGGAAHRQAGEDAAVVDLERALMRLQGNPALLARMVVQFREDADAGRKQMRDAFERRDSGAVAYAAHRLRGQALSLDAEVLATAVGTLERMVTRSIPDPWSEVDTALGVVDRELERVLDALVPR